MYNFKRDCDNIYLRYLLFLLILYFSNLLLRHCIYTWISITKYIFLIMCVIVLHLSIDWLIDCCFKVICLSHTYSWHFYGHIYVWFWMSHLNGEIEFYVCSETGHLMTIHSNKYLVTPSWVVCAKIMKFSILEVLIKSFKG